MRSLIVVELRRLLARRLFRVLSIVVGVAFAVAGTMSFVASDDSPERVAAAEAQRRADVARCVAGVESEVRLRAEHLPPEAAADPRGFCLDQTYGSDPRFRYADLPWILGTLGLPLMMLGWVVGASFIGAEWSNRTITTTLTWERRRVRVLAAKAIAVGTVVFLWALALQTLFAVVMYPAGRFEGTMAGVDAGWWRTWALRACARRAS
ncbi:MAG: hypothetical protein ABR575_10100 [Actinomycetota bacterium]